MAADPALGIRDLLVTAGVGVFAAQSGWGIFIGSEPDSPDTAITIYDSGGRDSDFMFLVDRPSVQVRIRGETNGYSAAWSKAYDVFDNLLAIPAQVLNGDRWDGITTIGNINVIGYDEKRRPIFTTNFNIIIEPASGVNRIPL